MKREIKFRAWDCQLKRWTNDSVLSTEGTGLTLNFNIVYDYFIDETGHECERFELMQYTGLKDKNGKEIYESDVVQHDFETEYGPVIHRDTVYYGGGAYYPICEKPETEFEVIGNIYENPKLLK